MKLNLKASGESGNTLIIVLLVSGLIVASLSSYLALTSTESKSCMRSLNWNAALPLAEAGAEEAMSHAFRNTNNFSLDGWVQQGTNNIFLKQRTNGNDFYTVGITGVPNSVITISSTGNVLTADNTYVKRAVQLTVQTYLSPPAVGLVANSINFGGDVGVDSYDSSDPLHSNRANTTVGFYDSSEATDQAFVGTPGLTLSLGGNSHVKGSVAAGIGGAVSRSGSASVGDASFSGNAIQAGHSSNNFAFNMPAVIVPFTTGNVPPTNSVNGTSYNYFLSGGKYVVTNLTAGGSSTTMYVSNSSVLYVPGNITLSQIVFNTNGSPRLDLYLGGSSLSFCPQVVGAAPTQFRIWALDSCTSLDMTGGSVFVGTVYARKAHLRAAGHAAFYGSFIADIFDCVGTFDFHFDIATLVSKPPADDTVLSWAEL